MKHVKIIGLAVMAAMCLMAITGAGTASASTLCKTKVNICPAGWKVKKGESIHMTIPPGLSTTLISPGGTKITCTGGTITVDSTGEGGESENFKGEVSLNSFSSCSATVDVLKKGTMEVEATSGGNGTFSSSGFEVTTVLFSVTCIYGSGSGTSLGSYTQENEHLNVNATLSKVGGSFLCPSTITWEGSYEITEPETVYVDIG